MGRVHCTRIFSRVLGENYVLLEVRWEFGKKDYEERAYFGVDRDGQLAFWSFTADGKSSQGHLADASDIHEQAISFEAQMPAGLARQVYWPGADGTVEWAVESKTRKGWRRFAHHHYRAM